MIHLTPGRYSRSAYSPRTEVIATAVEFVSATLSAAANAILPLSKAMYRRRSIPPDAITQVLAPCVTV